ncbi:MAG TPA: hypothetical protein VNF08_08625 [Acidimicrobiales bacterium]|nr:hypothetical protein [Acidimicrobiales bacterium]
MKRKVVPSHGSWFVTVSIREMGSETTFDPDGGTISDPENVVIVALRLAREQVGGAVIELMLRELTVIGTFDGFCTV